MQGRVRQSRKRLYYPCILIFRESSTDRRTFAFFRRPLPCPRKTNACCRRAWRSSAPMVRAEAIKRKVSSHCRFLCCTAAVEKTNASCLERFPKRKVHDRKKGGGERGKKPSLRWRACSRKRTDDRCHAAPQRARACAKGGKALGQANRCFGEWLYCGRMV